MRLRLLALTALIFLYTQPTMADEGMWMPSQLPDIAAQLKATGFQGNAKNLADLTRPPMNAVVKAGGATGAFVSADGLVLTNHHVAYGVIQYNSRPERNLLADGFIAADRQAELAANPDYRVLVTTGFDKVTDDILVTAQGQRGRGYFDAVEGASKRMVAQCEQEADTRCSIANVHYGKDFYLVRQLELRDIRLVYAPPESIGAYGDETDNFMWPRHAGDFTLLRAYVGKDGKPADYSADNVPYAPPAHLQVATSHVKDGDYAMLAGYPGRTFRHRSASEFANLMQWQLPTRIELFAGMIDTIDAAVESNDAAAVMYAAQLASMRNTLKRARGELEGLQRSNALRVRQTDETAMLSWLKERADGQALRADIDAAEAVLVQSRATQEHDQLFGLIRSQPQLLRAALSLQRLALERQKPDAERRSGWQLRDEPLIRNQLQQVQRRYSPDVEKQLLAELLRRYRALPVSQQDEVIRSVFGSNEAQTRQRLDELYAGTELGDEAQRLQWLDADAATLAKADDPLLQAASRLLPQVLADEDRTREHDGELLRLRPSGMTAWIDHRASRGEETYPDANGTVRVSYGRISPLQPRDAVNYTPLTTVLGITEKHTGVAPFDAPKPLLAAIAAGQFGDTADPSLQTQTVNLLTNLDTTGGNSGSPVLNARGEIIGVNFDSNWESVSASWMYDPRYKRAIHVDMRYMRWLMSRVYPAPQLLREMNLPDG